MSDVVRKASEAIATITDDHELLGYVFEDILRNGSYDERYIALEIVDVVMRRLGDLHPDRQGMGHILDRLERIEITAGNHSTRMCSHA